MSELCPPPPPLLHGGMILASSPRQEVESVAGIRGVHTLAGYGGVQIAMLIEDQQPGRQGDQKSLPHLLQRPPE